MKFTGFALVASGNAHCTLDKTWFWDDASVVATSVGPFTSPDECEKKCGGLANWNVNTQNDCFCIEDPKGHLRLIKANPDIRPEMGKTAACGGKALLSASAPAEAGKLAVNAANGVLYNMTDAEWKENKAIFDQNLEEFAQGNYISTLDVQYGGMTKCNQICTNWCWATSATMASSHFTSISSGQCAHYEAKAASLKVHKSCDSHCSSGCNQGGYPEDITTAISSFSGAHYRSGNTLSQQQLDNALSHGPVIFLIRWKQGGGHAITCSGVSHGKYQIHDPEGQDVSLSYSAVMHYSPDRYDTGTWTKTVYKGNSQSEIAV